ncbi:MAG: hypothetical protein AAF922_01225 [Pseudomonadota bacterium]
MFFSFISMRAIGPMFLGIASLCLLQATGGTASFAQNAPQVAALVHPEQGGPRRLEVTRDETVLFREPSEKADKLTELSSSAIVTNLGCTETAGLDWCKVSFVDGGSTGFIEMRHLIPAAGPDGIVATGVDDSKIRVRRRDYDATSEIACAQNEGQSLGRCRASIARSGGGDAAVVVTFSNSFSRELYFTHGQFRRGNSTMSGVGTDTEWRLENGIYTVRVDDQRYEIPEVFVLGK